MDERTEARVELARLEKQEQELQGLVEQLYSVRTAVRAQRTKLDVLIGGIHAPIHRLPNELLLRTFEFSIHAYVLAFPSCDVHRHWKSQLAGVSRHWRDMVLGFPRLWTTIRLTPTWSKSFVKAHVARSCQSPLDIEICAQDVTETFRASVDILADCTQRWRSLTIRDDVYGRPVLSVLFERMEHDVFPSLTHVSVERVPSYLTGRFSRFYSERCPHLQHLDLGKDFIPSLDFLIPPNLTSFAFAFGFGNRDPSSILQHVSLQKLTTLSLSGFCGGLKLHPNSLHLPLLKSFICKVSSAKVLIGAIVAPNLAHFTYSSRGGENDYGTEGICSSFPAVCHIYLDRDIMMSIFQPGNISNTGYWPNLESLTVHEPDKYFMECVGGLITWLEGRENVRQPKLLVRFTFPSFSQDWSIISTLYETLHEHCILEWGNVRLHSRIVFSNTANGSPWFVRAFRLIVPLVHQN